MTCRYPLAILASAAILLSGVIPKIGVARSAFAQGNSAIAPAASQHASKPRSVNNVDEVPYLDTNGKEAYRLWLSRPFPRAFAINPRDGTWAESPTASEIEREHQSGSAMFRVRNTPLVFLRQDVLQRCQKEKDDKCILYAENSAIVWDGKLPSGPAIAIAPTANQQTSQPRRVHDVDGVPYLDTNGKEAYRQWLARPYPRLFAINPRDGTWSESPTADEIEREHQSGGARSRQRNTPLTLLRQDILQRCQKEKDDKCILYAENGAIVWDGQLLGGAAIAQVSTATSAGDQRRMAGLSDADGERRLQLENQARIIAAKEEQRLKELQAKLQEERDKLANQIKLEEDRRRQIEIQAKISAAQEERRLKELQSKLEEERRRLELQAKQDEDRRRQVEAQAKLQVEQEAIRMRELQAKLEEDRRKLELQSKIEEERRLQNEQLTKTEKPGDSPLVSTRANRKALIIGNDTYNTIPKLRGARADGNAIEKVLTSLGYTVTPHYDLNEREMKRAIRDFTRQISGGDEVIFFYAGHGVQIEGVNYLLPTDIRAEDSETVRDEAVTLKRVLDDFSRTKARLTLAIIDACRDNPFAQSSRAIGGRGLAPTGPATGQMILFSAGEGQQALDRLGPNDDSPNGLFTRVFLKNIGQKGVSIDRVMRQVRSEVAQIAKTVGHDQVPALYDQVIGEFFFVQ